MAAHGNSELSLGDVLDELRRGRPHETAIVDGPIRLDYETFADRVDRLVGGLEELGVRAGDRIAWVGMNSFRVFELTIAASRTGALVCPLNWRLSDEEKQFVIDDLRPAVIAADEGGAGAYASGAWGSSARRLDAGGYEELVRLSAPWVTVRPVDPLASVLVMYTAAHDGRPNGAMLTNRGLHTAGVLHGVMNGVFEERPTFVACGPLYHIATFMGMVSTFLVGGTNVFLPRTDAAGICRAVDGEKVTWGYITGPTVSEVADHALATGTSLPTLFVPEAYVKADQRWSELGRPSMAPWSRHPGAFGQTEATGILTYTALAVGAKGLAGRVSPFCQVRIVDADDGEVGPGETGEIVARGPLVGNGYWNRPELNERRWRGGWWHTNDLGRREEDGSLTFVGPRTRMIKSAKENIYPAEVERCLAEHPQVKDAAVIGVPDERWEQSVKALVVRVDGSTITAEDLIQHCRQRIASYKKPRIVEFVESLPRTGPALDRDQLDRLYGGGGYVGE